MATAQEFYDKFRATEAGKDAPDTVLEECIYAFGTGEMADRLSELVCAGIKRATTDVEDLIEFYEERKPAVGDYNIVLNAAGEPVAITKVTRVEVTPFDEITDEYAFIEGEGDKSLAYWKNGHEKFFAPFYEEAGIPWTGKNLMYCIYFELVYK
ncbi:MAG: ASCH domain-containing protein [Lactobacillales bacterium]|jgi:uncharacterized protein YhfF|nr:ASCH domain-containing protein [Lactobacillales bacterium]